MSDQPILFSAPMVRALLDGRKTQTRRVLGKTGGRINIFSPEIAWADSYVLDDRNAGWRTKYIPYAPGDRLWVREAHSLHGAHGQGRDDGKRWGPWGGLPTAVSPDGTQVAYFREGFDRSDPGKWRPSIHMPRWASRITLIVTDVRVQRLWEISEADAIDEGCRPFFDEADPQVMKGPNGTEHQMLPLKGPLDAFQALWNSINGPEAWDQNPWVVALTFTVHRCNIDKMGGTHG
jgi:hypothetical protein